MERYKIFTGKNLSIEKYLKTWELDNETFEDKDKLSKKQALDWFKFSNKSTIVLWDTEKDELVGYITPFLLKHSFACEYIVSSANYKEAINEEVFATPSEGGSADIYLFSAVVLPKYRNKKIADKKSQYYGKSVFKVLNEALVDWIAEIKKKDISINYIFAEQVSPAGQKWLQSLGMQPCFPMKDDCKYAKLFTPAMFNRCSNVKKLYDLYDDDRLRKPFEVGVLNGHNYLSVKNNNLYYRDINLYDLVKKYKAPLEVAYMPIIEERVKYLKDLFAEKIEKHNYPKKYYYAYATKANYYSEVVMTALNQVDMLETSSAYDIDIIEKLAKDGYLKKGFTVICNGYKNEKYFETIKGLLKLGINVIPVIENEREFELLRKIKNVKINVGIRYNSDFESKLIKNNFASMEEFDNRFGFEKEQYLEMAEKISKCKNLNLQLFHFHFGGTISHVGNYIKGYSNLMSFYCELKKRYPSFKYFDFGGGFPVKYSLTYNFDYDDLVDQMVTTARDVCRKHKVECPDLIGEHGRFTVADHSFYIYKIDFTKQQTFKHWYMINGSLMNMTPDVWGIQQDFTILPVNLYENDCVPVCLGGETCDPDDRYFLNERNVKLFMPTIKKGQELYIAIFSIGAYQEIISGIGGLHHCLIPEGNEIVIYKEGKKLKYLTMGEVTHKEKVYDLLDYNTKGYMDRFFKKK